jgi:hypothetical protein
VTALGSINQINDGTADVTVNFLTCPAIMVSSSYQHWMNGREIAGSASRTL